MKCQLVVLVILLMAGVKVVSAADVIDPALIGTWKLDWQRAVDRRLGGLALPGPSNAAQKRMEELEKAKANGWKGRLPAGQSIPPQKGPKPFKGW